jgi:hypothetical protein
MDANFKASKPDAIEMTMTLTMSLWEWKKLREDLRVANASGSEFHGKISAMISAAEAHFRPSVSKADPAHST